MTSAAIREEIEAFFASYTGAFERFDAAALAAHFTYPFQIVAEGEPPSVTAIGAAEDYVAIISRFLTLYRKAGVAGGQIDDLDLTALSERVLSARIGWRIRNGDGATLYDFDSIYTLAKAGAAWRIAAIAHNELPRLQATLKRGA